MSARLRSVAIAVAIAAAATAYDPRAPAADPKRALGLLSAIVALSVSLARPSRERRALPPAVLAFVAFTVWSGLTLLWGVPAGVRDLASWVAGAALALAMSQRPLVEARRDAEHAAALAGSAAALVALGQRASGARGIFVHGGQGNANWLGLLLAVTLPLSVGLVVRLHDEGAKRARAAAMGAVLLQLAGLVLSHSRVAWMASALALGGMAISLVLKRIGARRRAPVIAGVVAAVALSFGFVRAPSLRGAPEAPPVVAEGDDVPVPVAFQGRVFIWRSSLDAAVASLPVGAGLGGFAHAYLDAQGARLAVLEPKVASRRFLNATTAHSDWIEVLVDGGLPALALLALAIFGGMMAAARSGWIEGAGALFALAVCAAGDSPMRQPGLVLLVGLVLGACTDLAGNKARSRAPAALAPTLRAGLLLASAWLLAVSVSGWIASRRLTAAKEALPEARRALLASAARLDPRSGEIALERGLFELASGDLEAALAGLRRSRTLLANVGTDVAIGNAEAELGRHEAAVEAYRAALRHHPGSFRAHANVTQPLLALGRLEEAEAHLAVARSLWPGHPRLGEMAEQLRRARIDRATRP
ncbi:TPR repeat protein [Minicystis rosea]|nr:TPR repeat protein [Minicystis rosea]